MSQVTVIIPAANAGRTITAALDSVFAQTFCSYDVIVVDDGSTDDTAVRIAEWGDRVRYVSQPNSGAGSARNERLRHTDSPLVAFLDADDLWLPRKLERQVAYYARFPETGLLHSAALVSRTPSRTILETPDAAPLDVLGDPPANVYCDLVDGTLEIDTRTVMARRDLLTELGGFDERRDRHVQDRDLWLRIAARHLVGYLPHPLAVHRAGSSVSRETGNTDQSHAATTFAGQRWLEPIRRARRAWRSATVTKPHNLTHDTAYRRARSAAVRAIHRVDDAATALGRANRRLLFEAASPMSLAVFRPVLDVLQRDPRIEVWFTTSDGAWDTSAVFGPAGITERVVAAADVRWMKFDAYVNTDFWNMTWLPRRSRRVHLFHGVAGKYGLDAPTRIAPVVATFDRLMFPNRDRLERYAQAGLVDPDGPAAALVGYPKVDCLVDGSLDRTGILRSLGLDPSAPTLLYAPTWSPYSSLAMAGESIISSLARLGGNVIVKLHDRSYDTSDRASGGIDWQTRIERVCRDFGVHVARGFDVSPYLFAADALITDHSSVGFEYMLLDRPIVVVDCPALLVNARVSCAKVALLRNAADVVDASDTAAAVRRALADPGRHSVRRRAVADALFYDPGHASARAADCIYDLLSLPHAVEVPMRAALAAGRGVPSFETRTT